MSNSVTSQLYGSSESTQKKKLQWQAKTNLEVYYMSIPGSRNQKFDNSKSSASAQAVINLETPKISNSEGAADPSLKLNQATAASATNAVPARTASLPNLPNKAGLINSTHAFKMNDTATTTSISLPTQTTVTTDPIPAPQNDVRHEQLSTVRGLETNKVAKKPDSVKPDLQQDDKMQRVCNTCKSKYEKEENTSDVEEWLYSNTCTNCRNVILSHHRSISRLQSPKHHKTTTNTNQEDGPHSCCCF